MDGWCHTTTPSASSSPSIPTTTTTKTTSQALPISSSSSFEILPLAVWKDHILPFLDRPAWNALMVADSSLWRQQESFLLPPWPQFGKFPLGHHNNNNNNGKPMNPVVVEKIQVSNEWIAVGCRDGSLILWHVRNGLCSSNNLNRGGGDDIKNGGENNYEKSWNGIKQLHEGGTILGLHFVMGKEINNIYNYGRSSTNSNNDWLISTCRKSTAVWNLQHILDNNYRNRKMANIQKEGGYILPAWTYDNRTHCDLTAMVGFTNDSRSILCGHDASCRGILFSTWKLEEQQQQQQKGRVTVTMTTNYYSGDTKKNHTVKCMAASNDHFACVCEDGVMIRLYCSKKLFQNNTSTAAAVTAEVIWKAHAHRIKALAFSLDGEFLASSSLGFLHNSNEEATISLWTLQGEAIYAWSPTDAPNINIYALTFLSLESNPCWLATGGVSGRIHIWDLTTPTSNEPDDDSNSENYRPMAVYPEEFGHDQDTAIYALAVYGTTLVSGGRDNTIRLWSIID